MDDWADPGGENIFHQLRLNQYIKQAVRWMPMEKWDRCAFATSEDDLEVHVCYGGHPVLHWMMDNIYIHTDPAGNSKPDKENSTEKIDGAVVTIMALDWALRCGNDTSASVYDSRGILFI